MTMWIILSGIIAPALFWMGYFYYKDRFRPEPLIKIGTCYVMGILSGFLCLKFFHFLNMFGLPDDLSIYMETNRWRYLLYNVLLVGGVEELFKFFPFLAALRFKAFDEKVDGFVYASMIALGFASYENSLYLVYMSGPEMLGRAFASPLSHTIFASIWGYAVGAAKIQKKSLWRAVAVSLPAAAIFHGVFNFLTTSPLLRIGSALLILGGWIWRIRIQDKSLKADKKLSSGKKF
ncbi:MAG: PrsW family intramembrane metalloprotease [Candidatus Aminicenantes bacterium]|nr:PrsW family intramembrane metalloprotease [Candidatus Aminicenantes bacterium]